MAQVQVLTKKVVQNLLTLSLLAVGGGGVGGGSRPQFNVESLFTSGAKNDLDEIRIINYLRITIQR